MHEVKISWYSNTNINSGLEYLPASLDSFSYYSLTGSHCKVKEIENILRQQATLLNEHYASNKWKKYWNNWINNNSHLVIICLEYERILSQLDITINHKGLRFKQLTDQFLPIFIFWMEETIRKLKNKLDAKQLKELTDQIEEIAL